MFGASYPSFGHHNMIEIFRYTAAVSKKVSVCDLIYCKNYISYDFQVRFIVLRNS